MQSRNGKIGQHRCGQPHSRQRRLRIENLESRYALSTVAETADTCLPDAPVTLEPPVIAYESPEATAPSPVGPLDYDSYFTGLDSAAPASTTQVAGQDDPPVLDSLSGSGIGVYWTITGHVTDSDPATCRVYFGGLLLGQSTPVMSDGSFIYNTFLPLGITGTIGAIAKDGVGNLSNIQFFQIQ